MLMGEKTTTTGGGLYQNPALTEGERDKTRASSPVLWERGPCFSTKQTDDKSQTRQDAPLAKFLHHLAKLVNLLTQLICNRRRLTCHLGILLRYATDLSQCRVHFHDILHLFPGAICNV